MIVTKTFIKLWLSADDTRLWADGCTEGSTLSDKRLFVEFDPNGVVQYKVVERNYPGEINDLDINQIEVPTQEINAITSDILRNNLSEDHPLYFITVGQFNNTQTR